MGKRSRLEDEGSDVEAPIQEEVPAKPSKKARKETNAGAQRTLFVRALAAVASTEALTELFSESYPLKHATVVVDPETKQSKGYGFVTFADGEDAQRAMDEFNGKVFLGRKMKLEIAQPRSRDVVKGEGLGAKAKSKISAEAAAIKKAREEQMADEKKPPKLIIRNLPWSVNTPEKLEELFSKYGKVKFSTLPKTKEGTQRGFGFIVMRGKKNAEKALAECNGMTVDGRQVAVDWAVEKDIYEGQKKPAEAAVEEEEESEDDEDAGVKVSGTDKPSKEDDVDDDVANFMKNFGDQLESEDEDDEDPRKAYDSDEEDEGSDEENEDDFEDTDEEIDSEEEKEEKPARPPKVLITDNSTTVFVRNLPFTTLDADLKEHFTQFGPVRYARVVMDRATARPKGTGFVCFFNVEDADQCARGAPRGAPTGANAIQAAGPKAGRTLLQNEGADTSGRYTIEGRVMSIVKAVEKEKAIKLEEKGINIRTERDLDKRKLYLLSEGTVAAGTPLYNLLAPSEVKMREESAMQRKKLIQGNPTLHLSLTRLSIRNLPRNLTSKELKALAREAVVGFAKDVKDGLRQQLSKEEEARGGAEMREAEKLRKSKGKGIVRQAKIVFESRDGNKVEEESGAGRSRGYGFVEYSSHRWALMGLRWMNGHAMESSTGKKQRLIVEFAIENAQVVSRRKEREEQARKRSLEIMAARERGEVPEKKKVLPRSEVMKKTRLGMVGKKGRPPPRSEKSFEKVLVKPRVLGEKRKAEEDDSKPTKRAKGQQDWKSHGPDAGPSSKKGFKPKPKTDGQDPKVFGRGSNPKVRVADGEKKPAKEGFDKNNKKRFYK